MLTISPRLASLGAGAVSAPHQVHGADGGGEGQRQHHQLERCRRWAVGEGGWERHCLEAHYAREVGRGQVQAVLPAGKERGF